MKVVVGQKKVNGKYQYGISVTSKDGKKYTATEFDVVSDNKFKNYLLLLTWATNKLKYLTMTGGFGEEERITLFINNKTVYTWFDNSLAPSPYTVLFSDLLLDLAFVVNDIEIIYSPSVHKSLTYKNSNDIQKGSIKAFELFAELATN